MMTAQITNGSVPIAGPKSRRNDRGASAGVRSNPSGCCSTSTANTAATTTWPTSFARLRSPRLVCRKILMKSSMNPTTPRPVISSSTRTPEGVIGSSVAACATT